MGNSGSDRVGHGGVGVPAVVVGALSARSLVAQRSSRRDDLMEGTEGGRGDELEAGIRVVCKFRSTLCRSGDYAVMFCAKSPCISVCCDQQILKLPLS